MLADRVARARESRTVERADPVTLEEFGYLLGRGRGSVVKTKAGVTMGPQRALGISSWYSGVRYIAETVAGLPCVTYRDSAGVRTVRADPPWKRRPDKETIWFQLVEFWVMSLLHKGNGYAFKVRNDLGQVVGLRPLHPDRVVPGQASDGTKVFRIDNDTRRGWTTREVLHIPGLSYDGIVGLNPIQALGEALGTVAGGDEYAARFFDGDDVRQYLSIPQTLTNDQANDMKASWEEQHRGLVASHEIAVMGGGAEYKTIDLDPQQTQLLESRKFGVAETARMLRLPPHKLYDLERATFSNIEQQSIEAVVDGIRPWCTRLEAHVNADPDLSPPRNFIEWNIEGLLRGDIKTRYEAYSAGIAGGFLTPAEPRAKENLPYVEGSEFLLRPLAMATYGPDAVEEEAASAPSTPTAP